MYIHSRLEFDVFITQIKEHFLDIVGQIFDTENLCLELFYIKQIIGNVYGQICFYFNLTGEVDALSNLLIRKIRGFCWEVLTYITCDLTFTGTAAPSSSTGGGKKDSFRGKQTQ